MAELFKSKLDELDTIDSDKGSVEYSESEKSQLKLEIYRDYLTKRGFHVVEESNKLGESLVVYFAFEGEERYLDVVNLFKKLKINNIGLEGHWDPSCDTQLEELEMKKYFGDLNRLFEKASYLDIQSPVKTSKDSNFLSSINGFEVFGIEDKETFMKNIAVVKYVELLLSIKNGKLDEWLHKDPRFLLYVEEYFKIIQSLVPEIRLPILALKDFEMNNEGKKDLDDAFHQDYKEKILKTRAKAITEKHLDQIALLKSKSVVIVANPMFLNIGVIKKLDFNGLQKNSNNSYMVLKPRHLV